ncbi:MAG: hypothetical protein IPM51_02085 [Sphingobacteriaceae bacterium]|nr:hypothetical protein [Sphingobacteriaceae bacterium]
MKSSRKFLFLSLLMIVSLVTFSQQLEEIKLNPKKIQQFEPYMKWKHGSGDGFEAWKSTNKLQYAKEMWYYSESFYIKRNHIAKGETLDESIIDISRFENQRSKTEEVIVTLPGFKDVVVLLPENKLIYKLN